MEPHINYITCSNQFQQYRMQYTAWGVQEHSHSTMLCLHALNRNSRDWDYVAQHFVKLGYYVIAPDLVGRGNSDYLQLPNGYDIPFYVADIMRLISTLKLTNINFLGTSLGGLVGMSLSIMPQIELKKLIINDIGAEINFDGISRISKYSANQPQLDTFAEAKEYIISISKPFGELPDQVWEHITRHSVQKNATGKYELKRDPKIMFNVAMTMANPSANKMLWEIWNKTTTPTLIIRGAESDILTRETVLKMCQAKPQTRFVEISHTGHAPFLYTDGHFNLINTFLEE